MRSSLYQSWVIWWLFHFLQCKMENQWDERVWWFTSSDWLSELLEWLSRLVPSSKSWARMREISSSLLRRTRSYPCMRMHTHTDKDLSASTAHFIRSSLMLWFLVNKLKQNWVSQSQNDQMNKCSKGIKNNCWYQQIPGKLLAITHSYQRGRQILQKLHDFDY